jgi:hypothetical protein
VIKVIPFLKVISIGSSPKDKKFLTFIFSKVTILDFTIEIYSIALVFSIDITFFLRNAQHYAKIEVLIF